MLLINRNRWGYFIAFVLLLISYFLIFFIIGKLARQSESITHSYDIINTLESIKAEITDAETGVRGYAITKGFSLPEAIQYRLQERSSFVGYSESSDRSVRPIPTEGGFTGQDDK
jgi:CHASE3 domain sensor protein